MSADEKRAEQIRRVRELRDNPRPQPKGYAIIVPSAEKYGNER